MFDKLLNTVFTVSLEDFDMNKRFFVGFLWDFVGGKAEILQKKFIHVKIL